MSYDTLLQKVRQAEQALEARERAVSADLRQVRDSWRKLWTPGRIAAIGVAAGFAVGWSRGGRAAAGSAGVGILRLASSMLTLVGSLQAKAAADEAEDAAQTAESTLRQATPGGARAAADAPAPGTDRRKPDPAWSTPPRAAEAATEVSEP
jgi:hypothetical protein